MELTLIGFLDAMGGWDIVYRMGAAVAVTKLFIEGIKAGTKKDPNNFIKIGMALIASALVSLAWGNDLGIWGRNTFVTFFTATFVWRDMAKPLLKRLGKNG